MNYLCLIYSSESAATSRPETERNAIFGEYMSFTQDIVKSGHLKGGEPLCPTSTATTVRVREGNNHGAAKPTRSDNKSQRLCSGNPHKFSPQSVI